MFRSILFYLAIFGIVSMVLLVRRQAEATQIQTPVPAVEPTTTPFVRTVGGRGIVESLGENVRIAPPVSGLVTEVFVEVGQLVTTGQALIELDSRTAKAELAIAQAQIPVLEARLNEAEAQLADRRDVFRRSSQVSTNVISETQIERDRFAVIQAESAVRRAQTEIESGKASLQRAQTLVDLLTVRAPRAGTILQVNVRPGEYASQLSVDPLVLLGQTQRLQLRVDIDEENASRIPPNTPGIAFPKGMPEFPISLTFERIEPFIVPKRSLTGQSTERVDTRVLQVIYTFSQGALPVYVGQQMDVFLDAQVGDTALQDLDQRATASKGN
jgi:RND family efflux transporter MFP subunit